MGSRRRPPAGGWPAGFESVPLRDGAEEVPQLARDGWRSCAPRMPSQYEHGSPSVRPASPASTARPTPGSAVRSGSATSIPTGAKDGPGYRPTPSSVADRSRPHQAEALGVEAVITSPRHHASEHLTQVVLPARAALLARRFPSTLTCSQSTWRPESRHRRPELTLRAPLALAAGMNLVDRVVRLCEGRRVRSLRDRTQVIELAHHSRHVRRLPVDLRRRDEEASRAGPGTI